MTTDKHVDPSVAPKIIEEENQPVHADVPEGALPFKLTAEEIQEAMMESSIEVKMGLQELPEYISYVFGSE